MSRAALSSLPILAFLAMPLSSAQAQGSCSAKSAARVPAVVELYTSEGCNSCPPADAWLSQQIAKRGEEIIALAFHVDYWDYIGWKDEFAKPEYGQRHRALVTEQGSRTVYTPQVFVNGREDRGWSRSGNTSAKPARGQIALAARWQGNTLNLTGAAHSLPQGSASQPFKLRYALTESKLVTPVAAGENKGVTLRHDGVVRSHGYLTAKADGSFAAAIDLPTKAIKANTLVHVIAESANGEPIAAASLACS